MKLGIIGGGVMGEIITHALILKNILKPDQIFIADIDNKRLKFLKDKHGICIAKNNLDLLEFGDILVICVKPQDSQKVMQELKGKFKTYQLVISIMAGVSISTLRKSLGHPNIVRSMPNIPADIGEGMTVWIATESLDKYQKLITKMIFQSFGKEIEVNSDDLVDSATAISGTGPAYIYYFAENLVKIAKNFGYNDTDAHKLVQQTFKGAMNLWAETGEDPESLRLKVTSKKGTTDAAINTFMKLKLDSKFHEGVKAAYKRCKELGKINSV